MSKFLILGSNSFETINGGVNVDYVYNNFNLSNLWDQIILEHLI